MRKVVLNMREVTHIDTENDSTRFIIVEVDGLHSIIQNSPERTIGWNKKYETKEEAIEIAELLCESYDNGYDHGYAKAEQEVEEQLRMEMDFNVE